MESGMESEERRFGAAGRTMRRALGWTMAGGAVLAGVLVLLPDGEQQQHQQQPVAPAPGPKARARAAAAAGVPAAMPDLAELIGDRERRLRKHPEDGRSWAVLGTAYVERGRRTGVAADFPRAERALRYSLKVRPSRNAEAYDGLAALATARHDFPAARQWGEQAVRVAPERWTAYPLLIDAYDGVGDYRAARRTLDQLLALRSRSAVTAPAVTARAAQVYWDQGRREDAAAALSDAAAGAQGPAERATYLVLAGELAWQRGDLKESLRYGTAALHADPDEHAALAVRARALAALGRTEEAVRAYRSALAKARSPRYALELGELYESLGRQGEARAQYGVLRETVRADAKAGVNHDLFLGLFEADHGDPERAVRLLRGEWERQPSLRTADALGWALHRAGEDEEALVFATRATDRAHGGEVRSALYAYHRGEIEYALERPGPARRHLAEALRLNPYFSLLHAPVAREALGELGEPSDEGPAELGGQPGGPSEDASADASAETPAEAPAEAPA
ncbi:tetratricopeptide repeat protein [Streptomyces acidicola]|uniref:tetratricopeptide repeat protein n=1 Tax=Streptomyces acidicola TaxID=2596892 RepID=UPI00342189C4